MPVQPLAVGNLDRDPLERRLQRLDPGLERQPAAPGMMEAEEPHGVTRLSTVAWGSRSRTALGGFLMDSWEILAALGCLVRTQRRSSSSSASTLTEDRICSVEWQLVT